MKTWLVTGCSSGLGRGIAKAALKKGYNVVVTARNTAAVNDLVEKYPDTAIIAALDVTDKQSISNAVRMGQEKFGAIDVLVNNAGYGYRSAVEEGEPENVNMLFDTNFFGPIELIKELLPQMRANKNGAIINVSSIAAVRSGVGSGYYAASKAALELMTDGLKKELEPLGIKVMIAQPGAFRTNFYSGSLKGTLNKIDDYAETAGKNRKENVVDKQNQPGDPDKGGELIVDVIERENYPKRLLLGSDAVKVVSEELKNQLQEIEDWRIESRKSNF